MAAPTSSHRDPRDRDRDRAAHHHHRTISSTTLLLILSLILAVLAVMLSIPRSAPAPVAPAAGGLFGFLTPKRPEGVVDRESAVAQREAEVARREADLLGAKPIVVADGTSTATLSIGTCLPCTTFVAEPPNAPVTVIREVETLSPPWWKDAPARMEDIAEREARISEREKEVGRREEIAGRRESEAGRREAWIMEHLMAPPGESLETEEYIYEQPTGRRTKELPPMISVLTETHAVTHTITHIETQSPRPSPANTRFAAQPAPEAFMSSRSEHAARTTAVEVIVEHEEQENDSPVRTVTVVRGARPTQRPRKWFGGW